MEIWQKFYKTLASVRTGIILLLVVVLVAALGTVILQRPTSEADVIQRTYSPQTLALLDRTGLTDIYHAWYFMALLGLVSLSLIFVSIERWPNAWKFYAKPYRRPEQAFRLTLPNKQEIPVKDSAEALAATERAFQKLGVPVEREVDGSGDVSLYSEKHRFSVMSVFIVHASLLLLFAGYILDGMIGYRGFMSVMKGETSNKIELRTMGATAPKIIPFSVRCDALGQENYEDGMPKKYWSNLTIIENGREVRKKQIIVNDPLTYRGIRMFQASMGQSGKIDKVTLVALNVAGGERKDVLLGLNETVALDDQFSVRMVRFVPDFYEQDGEVYTKSEYADNPAFQLALVNKAGQETKMWLKPSVRNATMEETAYRFAAKHIDMVGYTGLEVSYQPGQWFIWAGVLLMAVGLGFVFYFAHTRYWAIVVPGANGLVLWVGGTCNRNRERFEQSFSELISAIRAELPADSNNKTDRAMHETASV
jgi:cytochrome c biogenesis protein